MRFDVIDLRLFVNIYKAGSMTAGANLSHLSLQSASERIRGMEAELGVLLFIRNKSGVTLTNVGFALLNHANTILLQVEHMRSELQQYSQGLRGQIHLLCNSSAQSGFLPKKIGAYLLQQPNISLSINEMPSEKIIHNIHSQIANLGIIADSATLHGLMHKTLCDDPLVVFMPLSNALCDRDIISFSEIAHYELIGLSENTALQDHIDGHATALGIRLNYRVRMGTMDAVMQVVSQGTGLAILPLQVVSRFIGSYQGTFIPLMDEWAKRKLFICARDFDELPSYINEFIDFLLK